MKKDFYGVARDRMVKEQIIARGIRSKWVIEMMQKIPRHLFLDEGLGPQAYSDHSFPIGFRQTMSKPYIVAYLAEQLELSGGETVLEVGTGSGYQAAILSGMAARIFSIERISQLATKAKRVLNDLGIRNVSIKVGNGTEGWPEMAPFDRILLTAAACDFPNKLIGQLAADGIILGPFESRDSGQQIIKLRRNGGRITADKLEPCSFVPLVTDDISEESH